MCNSPNERSILSRCLFYEGREGVVGGKRGYERVAGGGGRYLPEMGLVLLLNLHL